jgi:hypothetical protein
LRQEGEDPATPVVDHDEDGVETPLGRPEQPPGVVEKREVSEQPDHRRTRCIRRATPAPGGDTEHRRDEAIDPVHPSIGEDPPRDLTGERLEVAHRHARGDDQRRVERRGGARRRDIPSDPALEGLVVTVEEGVQRSPRRLFRLPPLVMPFRRGRGAAASLVDDRTELR